MQVFSTRFSQKKKKINKSENTSERLLIYNRDTLIGKYLWPQDRWKMADDYNVEFALHYHKSLTKRTPPSLCSPYAWSGLNSAYNCTE